MRWAEQDFSSTDLVEYEIMEDCWINTGRHKHHIPKGFVTDFASIPLPLRLIFPSIGKHRASVVIHDKDTHRAKTYGIYTLWEEATEDMRYNIANDGTNKIRAWCMVKGVWLWGLWLKANGVLS